MSDHMAMPTSARRTAAPSAPRPARRFTFRRIAGPALSPHALPYGRQTGRTAAPYEPRRARRLAGRGPPGPLDRIAGPGTPASRLSPTARQPPCCPPRAPNPHAVSPDRPSRPGPCRMPDRPAVAGLLPRAPHPRSAVASPLRRPAALENRLCCCPPVTRLCRPAVPPTAPAGPELFPTRGTRPARCGDPSQRRYGLRVRTGSGVRWSVPVRRRRLSRGLRSAVLPTGPSRLTPCRMPDSTAVPCPSPRAPPRPCIVAPYAGSPGSPGSVRSPHRPVRSDRIDV